MKRIARYLVLAAMVSFLLGSAAAVAKDRGAGPVKSPSGWDQGEKTGWEGEHPPGLEKKAGEEKDVKERKEKKEKKVKEEKKIKNEKNGSDEEDGKEINKEETRQEGLSTDDGEVKGQEGAGGSEQGTKKMNKEAAETKANSPGKKRGLTERIKSFFGGRD